MSAPEHGSTMATADQLAMAFAAPGSSMLAAAHQDVVEMPAAAAESAVVTATMEDLMDALNIGEQDQIKDRRLLAHFEGTLREWDLRAPRWTPADLNVLRRPAAWSADGKPSGRLDKVLLLKATVRTKENSTPVPIGVKITGVAGNCFGDSMEHQFADVCLAGQLDTRMQVVHEASTDLFESAGVLSKYAHIKSRDEFLAGTKEIDEEMTYVKPKSPFGELIRNNEETFKANWASLMADLAEGKYIRVAPEQVKKYADLFEQEVLSKKAHVDFNNFAVELVRTDGRRWSDPKGWKASGQSAAAMASAPMDVTVELSLDYIINDAE